MVSQSYFISHGIKQLEAPSIRRLRGWQEMAKRPIKHLRWYIVVLLGVASELNYMDRATLSVVKEQMQRALHFDDKGYAIIGATFLWVYAFAYLVVGWIVDRIGSRKSMLLFVSGWSIANMLHAFTSGVTSLAIFRG